MDLIVCNNKESFDQSKHPGKVINYIDFIQMATDSSGLDVSGTLYLNLNDIDANVYSMLKDSGAKFFVINNESVPSFYNGDYEDWSINNNPKVEETLVPDLSPSQSKDFNNFAKDFGASISNLFDSASSSEIESEEKQAKVYVFGSSKGGTGKTFTSMISAYRYAKMHPDKKIGFFDFDIVDGQVGLALHKVNPTLRNFITQYQQGNTEFEYMQKVAIKNSNFPPNIEFYLAPSSGYVYKNNDFWAKVIENAISNYDVVIFDTGLDYLNIRPIIFAYKMADKIILTSSTTIKSVSSVIKQIRKLTGEVENLTYTEDDDLATKINIVIVAMGSNNEINQMVYNSLNNKANVVATFGRIDDTIAQAEYLGRWSIFDDKQQFNDALDKIME